MPVHIYGHPVDMDPVLRLAAKHGLVVIEDAAEAHGAEYLSNRDRVDARWRRCGGLGHLSTFSFYANKIITTGEGGMVLTADPDYANRLRGVRNLFFRPERRFWHRDVGHNYRLTNLQAAVGLAQLERIDVCLEKKRWIGRTYGAALAGIPWLRLPHEAEWAKNVYWMYGVVLEEERGVDATEFAHRLKDKGVETRPFFLGMHEQPVFLDRGLFRGEHYPVAERLARQGLYLPSGLTLTGDQIQAVAEAVRGALS